MNNQIVGYDLENEVTNGFDRVMFRLRRLKRKRVVAPLKNSDYQDVDLFSIGKRIRMKVKVDDIYFFAYQKIDAKGGEGDVWEARTKGQNELIPRSKSLNFTVNYSGGVLNRMIGIEAIRKAFDTLWTEKPPSMKIEQAFQTLAINFCEAARFEPIYHMVLGTVEKGIKVRVPTWMNLMINSWEKLSDILKEDPGIMTMQLPRDIDANLINDYVVYNYNTLFDPEKNKLAAFFARHCVRIPHIKAEGKAAKANAKK